MGMDVFMLWNGAASESRLTARFRAKGRPELWNPSTAQVSPLDYTAISSDVKEVKVVIPAGESVIVLFKAGV